MNLKANNLQELLSQLSTLVTGVHSEAAVKIEAPFRSELFNSDQMIQHSPALARSHKLSNKKITDRLLPRLADNAQILLQVRQSLTKAIKQDYQMSPAGEWLLDNFYLIEEQIRLAKKHLPKGYSEGLPQLQEGTSAGLPRVYDIVLELISHSDGKIDEESIGDFIKSYSTVTHLKLGELWAIPIMLRLALIENLRRVAALIALSNIQRNLADYWAKELSGTAESKPQDLILVLADMARSNPPLERSFVAEFTRQLRGKGPSLAQALNWMEQRLAENGQTSNELVQDENQQQAADQVSVSNSIASLRALSAIDWRNFVETHSVVEQTLREDAVYPHMDFSTRDLYRHVIERLTKNSKLEEEEVARIAVQLAQNEANHESPNAKTSHVGYYLIGKGLEQTEKLTEKESRLSQRLKKTAAKFSLTIYLGSIFLITSIITAAIVLEMVELIPDYRIVTLIGILSFICSSQLSISLVNFFSTLIIHPEILPRLDFSEAIPEQHRTLVVVPCMLTSMADIDAIAESLEVHFLANKSENLHFGLLTDFKDAKHETVPEDHELLQFVQQRIQGLIHKYSEERSDLFFLFHRPRKWNPAEGCWMGYERKRGKLEELNSLLRGGAKDCFSLIVGEQSVLPKIKYVITLDADTQLPRDAAWKMIGTMSHPLNDAVYDPEKKRVVEGYGILQPRVSVSLPDVHSSLYARMNGNEPGIDPYTRAVSDIYQDIFQEGSFIGKGIYNVDIFFKVLHGKFPENRILSHDLLEGCYTRSGLLSDVQLYEKYPSGYITDMQRRHRWIRGDWQIMAWILPIVPGSDFRWHYNPLSPLSKWKIFDNIRRSLIALALTAFIILGWTLLPSSGIWTLLVTGIIILPGIVFTFWDIIRKPKDVILRHHLILFSRNAGKTALQTFFTVICLPYEAYVSLDAIVKTIWRILFSHKKLLKWKSLSVGEYGKRKTLTTSYLFMWAEPTAGLIIFIWLFFSNPVALPVAIPVLLLWVIAPVITWNFSLPVIKKSAELTARQNIFLRKLARKTWFFFDQFVTADDNWLPPDNFQEIPQPMVAHRTSPTNMGLYLLSNLTAHDFGYITTADFIERTNKTIATMNKLERYRGHFYNWYDTQSLRPLSPRYISTVDSGNLAGHLLTLRQGVLNIPNQKLIGQALFYGLRDTFNILKPELKKTNAEALSSFESELKKVLANVVESLESALLNLKSLQQSFIQIEAIDTTDNETATQWKHSMSTTLNGALEELQQIAPWVFLPAPPEKYKTLLEFNHIPTLSELYTWHKFVSEKTSELVTAENTAEEKEWLSAFQTRQTEAAKVLAARLSALEELAEECNHLSQMELDFLYDKTKDLLTIGYNVEEHRCDPSYYDLLASEVRLGIFVGIAQGRLPQESWFALGRLLTNVDGHPILLSWSGSMFEYLMPLLVMPTYQNTLLDQSYKETVGRQIDYGKQRNIPWGISESCYNIRDNNQNYQYKAFGVPGLGLKRGLGEDLIIAPYATIMALMVDAKKACDNLQQMAQKGFEGVYGFYDAIDYTPSRVPPGQSQAIVQTYMAHHQGMSFLSLAYALLDQPMQKLFAAEPQFQATLLLLQERIPKASTFYRHITEIAETQKVNKEPEVKIINTPNTAVPAVQLLSNGRYHVMVTNSGGGYSKWKNLAVTRWREDTTRDNWGVFCYIRDNANNTFWSVTHQPTLKTGKNFEVAFSQGRADLHMVQNNIVTHVEMVVSPEDDIEMRRVHLTNLSGKRRTLDITTYAEVVIAPPADDEAHPAFSNLFVQTEILPNHHAILCTRRPKSSEEKPPWMFHMVKLHEKNIKNISYETDRLKFIGRGNTLTNPAAMQNAGELSGTQGPVLDPVVSIRVPISLEPDETVTLDLVIGMAETRETCQNLVDKYQDKHHKDRVFELAWVHNQIITRQLNASNSDAQLYNRLAGSILFNNQALRAASSILIRNQRGQSGLWPYSISGDLPIVLLKIEEETEIELVRQLVQAHAYWQLKGLMVDLIIWNEKHGGYRQLLHNQIAELLSSQPNNQQGSVYLRSGEQMSEEDRVLFQTVARVVITGSGGSLADHILRKNSAKLLIPQIAPVNTYSPTAEPIATPKDLLFFNGLGGFSPDGKEYVIHIPDGDMTPAPWVNVIANPNFGTVVSEAGQSYTWSENAHEFRLTPWNNDQVSDAAGEIFYLRDEETGHVWSPTALPKNGRNGYIVRHGFGYSIFEHEEDGIHSELCVYVDLESAIKFSVLKLKNNSGKARHISVTGYAEIVLGDLRTKTSMYLVTEFNTEVGALFAKNPYSAEFCGRTVFFDTDESSKSYTGDRSEFIGRNGNLENPDAMLRTKLSGKTGVGLDPCLAMRVAVDLFDGQEREIIFKLGAGVNMDQAQKTILQFKGANQAKDALNRVIAYWEKTLGTMQVETPDAATNLLANGWLLYQTISCRLWGRSGFYQSGGAFGFRDQLQDVMALTHAAPQLTRAQIILSASRQFVEGDVQHWWHPPMDRGVRTRCSDDFLWLPFAVCHYVSATGDTDILQEKIPFLKGRTLNQGEDSYYEQAVSSRIAEPLYNHCVKAITHGLQFGANGLPLMGTGDWNDGMDRVGKDGKGESVWLAFFLYDILNRFAQIAQHANDTAFADRCTEEAKKLQENIAKCAWDGEWYLRAFFDDGSPLGSSSNPECNIDSIAQSWSVLSGAGEAEHTQKALDSAYSHLVKKEDAVIKLLTPAFDKSDLEPGYIKGYLPGVRENGGQYTHAAVWLIMAFAKMGNRQRTWELLQLIYPINHGKTADEIKTYTVEPYVTAGDVYAEAPHTGKGGWTWYTGSAGWMYRLITESFLGIIKEGNLLKFNPCIPAEWASFKVHYRFGKAVYHIQITQTQGDGEMTVMLDNVKQEDKWILLKEEEGEHSVAVTVTSKPG